VTVNPKHLKLIAGFALLGGALVVGMGPSTEAPKVSKVRAGAKTPETVGLLAMTHPEDSEKLAEGSYVFEGQIGKGSKVKVLFDDRDPVNMEADADGAYRFEAKKVTAGEHKIEVLVTEKGAKPVKEELAFTVQKGAQKSSKPKATEKHSDTKKHSDIVAKHDKDEELPVELLPNDDGSDVVYTKNPGLGTDDIAKKDEVVAAEAHAKPAAKGDAHGKAGGHAKADTHAKPGTHAKGDTHSKADAHAKPDTHAKTDAHGKPAGKKVAPKKPASKFVISSHSNFNVVPHGVVKVGGKGTPGDKIMLLVDGKPSMRGTVKPNGRWSFPVKVSNAGFRKITAQNLKTRQQVWVKLKIK
jgi:hypothetical protein